MNPLLSIIVISHEQREELKRCLDSILAMKMPFAYEIIVSDDRSADGTREMLKEYSNERVSELTNGQGKLVVTYCNSDEGNCANNSQRSGYNRCNAYPLAKGKYIAHVDADDYFREGADVYVRQVEALEQHPECSLAMSSVLWLDVDCEEKDAKQWNRVHSYHDGDVFSSSDYIENNLFIINQAFIQRRNPEVNPVDLYGNRYVDSVITFHHMQFGKIVYVEACDYVYVQHRQSVTGNMAQCGRDLDILWCMPIYIGALIPCFWHDYIKSEVGYWSVRRVVDMAIEGYNLSEKNRNSLSDLSIWIYRCFLGEVGVRDKVRLRVIRALMKVMKKCSLFNYKVTNILKIMLFV